MMKSTKVSEVRMDLENAVEVLGRAISVGRRPWPTENVEEAVDSIRMALGYLEGVEDDEE